MGIVHKTVASAGHALSGVRAGADKLAARKIAAHLPASLELRSPAFQHGDPLPPFCAADQGGEPPRLAWDPLPEGTESAVLICEDPDAPFPQPFVHWLVYGIPATAVALATPLAKGIHEGENSTLKLGYTGAAPPPGHGVHHYHFQLFALDTAEQLYAGAGRRALLEHMSQHVLAWGELIGTYQRD